MEEKRPSILVVDDDARNHRIMEGILEDDFTLQSANSGPECLAALDKYTPDLILLDVMMPDMDGYEVCQRLKEAEKSANIPVIFVTGKDSLEERIQGFDVGAEDYFVKPFDHDELLIKINKTLNTHQQRLKLTSQAAEATNMAMQAMKDTGELGLMLRFFEASFTAKNFDDLSKQLFETTRTLNWSCSIQIRDGLKTHNATDCGIISPMEESLLTQTQSKGRFFDFRHRTIVNFDHITIIIKNMPVDDPVRYGTIKDNVCILLNGAEARIKALIIEMEVEQHRCNLIKTIESTLETMDELRNSYHTLRLEGASIVEDIKDCSDDLIFSLGLTEPQETALQNITEQGVSKTVAMFNKGIGIDSKFNSLTQQLNEISTATKIS